MIGARFEPVVAIEVDGLLSVPVTSPAGPPPDQLLELGLVIHRQAFPYGTVPEPVWDANDTWTSRHWFSRLGLAWVNSLVASGVEVVWASAWLEYANLYFAPNLGLPHLPVAITKEDWAGPTVGDIKARQLARQFDGRPLLLITDALPLRGRRHLDALRRPVDRALTSLTYIPWHSPVTEEDIDDMNRWLELASTPDGHDELRRQRRRDLARVRRRRERANRRWTVQTDTDTDTDATADRVPEAEHGHVAGPAAVTPVRFTSETALQARRVGDAARAVWELLDDTDAARPGRRGDPLGRRDITQMRTVLRELVDAISALSPPAHKAPLTAEETSPAIPGGVPEAAFTEQARRDGQDWVVWSAIRDDAERRTLDELIAHAIFGVLPGLRDAIDAFPDGYTDLDKYKVLSSPDEALGGLSPVELLLLGCDAVKVTTFIDDLNRPP